MYDRLFSVIVIKSCADSVHGCCPDGKTAAQGPNQAGCPSKQQISLKKKIKIRKNMAANTIYSTFNNNYYYCNNLKLKQ